MSKLKVLFVVSFILCANCWVYAADVLWSSVTEYTSTKTNKTVPVSQAEPIKVITATSGCKAYINNTNGTGMPIPANTYVDIKTPGNVSNIIFGCPSTASPGSTVTAVK